MDVLLANPRGFCAGVERALRIVEELLEVAGPPIYVRHAIVHNHVVVEDLSRRGVVFVEDLAEIPRGAIAVMSAHGVSPAVMQAARARGLRILDGTCPLVTKVQLEVLRHARVGRSVVVIGHRGHVEVDGLVGHYDPEKGGTIAVVEDEAEAETLDFDPRTPLAYVTQTTLAVSQTAAIIDVLKRRFPAIVPPHGETICYATQSRQDAVRRLAEACDAIIVIGAPHSSNSRRLKEVAEDSGRRALLIETPEDLTPDRLVDCTSLGLTASASAPEHLVSATIERLAQFFPGLQIAECGTAEDVRFRLPKALRAFRPEGPDQLKQ